MPWRSCRSIRPKRSRNCTRVVPTQGLCRNCVQQRNLAIRAMKVTARSLGRNLWLNLTDMREAEKVRFLNAPVFQTGFFGDTVENFAQQFSVAQKLTEAIKHILPRRPAAASTRSSAAAPPSAHRRGTPPVSASPPGSNQQPPPRRQAASHKGNAQPVQALAKPGSKHKGKRP